AAILARPKPRREETRAGDYSWNAAKGSDALANRGAFRTRLARLEQARRGPRHIFHSTDATLRPNLRAVSRAPSVIRAEANRRRNSRARSKSPCRRRRGTSREP